MAIQSLNNRGELRVSTFLVESKDFYKELLDRANKEFDNMSDGA